MKDTINIILKEHEKIRTVAQPIIEAAKKGDALSLHGLIERLMEKMVPLITSHFMLEENILYPAIVLNNEAADMIDEILLIQKEHGVLEQQLRQLIYLVKITSPDDIKECSIMQKLLLTETLELYNNMIKHQKDEDTLFKTFGVA